jgi:hypothetical protein
MGQVLHGSARATAAVRRTIQQSQESLKTLAGRPAAGAPATPGVALYEAIRPWVQPTSHLDVNDHTL